MPILSHDTFNIFPLPLPRMVKFGVRTAFRPIPQVRLGVCEREGERQGGCACAWKVLTLLMLQLFVAVARVRGLLWRGPAGPQEDTAPTRARAILRSNRSSVTLFSLSLMIALYVMRAAALHGVASPSAPVVAVTAALAVVVAVMLVGGSGTRRRVVLYLQVAQVRVSSAVGLRDWRPGDPEEGAAVSDGTRSNTRVPLVSHAALARRTPRRGRDEVLRRSRRAAAEAARRERAPEHATDARRVRNAAAMRSQREAESRPAADARRVRDAAARSSQREAESRPASAARRVRDAAARRTGRATTHPLSSGSHVHTPLEAVAFEFAERKGGFLSDDVTRLPTKAEEIAARKDYYGSLDPVSVEYVCCACGACFDAKRRSMQRGAFAERPLTGAADALRPLRVDAHDGGVGQTYAAADVEEKEFFHILSLGGGIEYHLSPDHVHERDGVLRGRFCKDCLSGLEENSIAADTTTAWRALKGTPSAFAFSYKAGFDSLRVDKLKGAGVYDLPSMLMQAFLAPARAFTCSLAVTPREHSEVTGSVIVMPHEGAREAATASLPSAAAVAAQFAVSFAGSANRESIMRSRVFRGEGDELLRLRAFLRRFNPWYVVSR